MLSSVLPNYVDFQDSGLLEKGTGSFEAMLYSYGGAHQRSPDVLVRLQEGMCGASQLDMDNQDKL